MKKPIQDNRWKPDSFSTGNSTTGATNVLAIVAELPLAMISSNSFGFYATVCANDHGHWTQVNRCGKPNFAATFNDNPEGSRLYNSTDPDYANFAQPTIDLVVKVCRAGNSSDRPEEYGQLATHWLFPEVFITSSQ